MDHVYGAPAMMPTFLYDVEAMDDDAITVTGPEAQHMMVLRLHKGEMVRLIDGRGQAQVCEIAQIRRGRTLCTVIKSILNDGEPARRVTLAIGLSTDSKFDTIIEKGTEIGISRFIPLLTDRSRIKIGDSKALKRKLDRWARVCLAAVKQSGRSILPMIDAPTPMAAFLESTSQAETLLFHPDQRSEQYTGTILSAGNDPVTLVIGPESGFSEEEIVLVREKQIGIFHLGNRVLRTETAGIVIPAIILYPEELTKDKP